MKYLYSFVVINLIQFSDREQASHNGYFFILINFINLVFICGTKSYYFYLYKRL